MKLQNINKKRLILIDLDGSALMSNGKKMHQKTKEVLTQAINDGHIVCIVTGRPHRSSIRFYKELNLTTLLVNYDGGHTHDPVIKKFKRLIFPINGDIVQDIINNKVIKKASQNLLIESYSRAIIQEKNEFMENFFHLDDVAEDEFYIGDPYKEWKGPATNVVFMLKNSSNKDEVFKQLEKYKYSIKIQSGNMYGYESADASSLISLTSKIVNKGFAAEILAQYYNKDMRDVIAFGDQLNDFEMISSVGYGIAMKNANDELKKVSAGITTLTNDEGGIGEYLERLLSGEEV